MTVTVTEATCDGVVTSEQPVVTELWAPWCRPCRVIAPVLDELAREVVKSLRRVEAMDFDVLAPGRDPLSTKACRSTPPGGRRSGVR